MTAKLGGHSRPHRTWKLHHRARGFRIPKCYISVALPVWVSLMEGAPCAIDQGALDGSALRLSVFGAQVPPGATAAFANNQNDVQTGVREGVGAQARVGLRDPSGRFPQQFLDPRRPPTFTAVPVATEDSVGERVD